MAIGDDRRTVTIRNNHTDHRRILKRRKQLRASLIVVIIAALLVAGIYFRVDEKVVALVKEHGGIEFSIDSDTSLFARLFPAGEEAVPEVEAP